MATIVQNYGPIYGEIVNGTVQGRPNGSVYVPITNIIELHWNSDVPKTLRLNGTVAEVTPLYGISAIAQDLSSYMRSAVYTDSACTTLYCSYRRTAGQFNKPNQSYVGVSVTDPVVDEQTYYMRAELMNNGEPVAVSSVYELTGDAGE